ncbi:CaiB/BaiF CoA transferase family protein [Sphingomonas immobilis]|uniref:CaiB/BaiF CoA-transferase family protein n=1 Tax=Sphingomonas immobilis TaxID=3063997 RepID=A0ABT9A0Y7_9SPHN|nr:CaiB/BaiF CoA-transferase family protein [Sphingomonas sp. CA1-15]MDO7843122.1 CaiB/BaiF CoA-transferase family protein [Sphingomonas sp. CA1-15]
MTGPLKGLRVVEIAGIGPGPFACMMLADHGAEVIRIDRADHRSVAWRGENIQDVLNRSRRRMTADLKTPEGLAIVRKLVATADVLIEGFRPGVMERLGLGPDDLIAINPKLVYGRMTGWGQTGPYAQAAGHDVNYVALSGLLHAIGRKDEPPVPPLNLVGDFGGGAMMLVFGVLAAVIHARQGGDGQVVDCSMSEGSALLGGLFHANQAQGVWQDERGSNLVDGGAHFYDVYETADGKYVSIAAIEPQFYALLRNKLGIADDPDFDDQMEESHWPALKPKVAAIFKQKTRDAWCAVLEHSDACFAPVLSLAEARTHPHNVARQVFVEVNGVPQPAPAPRYSKTLTDAPWFATEDSTDDILREIRDR